MGAEEDVGALGLLQRSASAGTERTDSTSAGFANDSNKVLVSEGVELGEPAFGKPMASAGSSQAPGARTNCL